MLRPFPHPVACCCAKFETGQTFHPTTPNISFVLWSPKRSATMLDPFVQLFQHCCGHARSLRMVYKDLWVVSFPRCTAGPNIVGSCCISLHNTANTDATTANIVDPTILGVVRCVRQRVALELRHAFQASPMVTKINFLRTISILDQEEIVRELIKWSPKDKILWSFDKFSHLMFQEMYGDHSGGFLCGYCDLKD